MSGDGGKYTHSPTGFAPDRFARGGRARLWAKPAIAGIIRFDASAELTDYKILTGKLVTKGELTVRIIYQCEEDAKKLEMMEYSLPVSQVVDIDGLEEDCACSAWYEVSTCEITPKTNSDGENRMFALECSMNACVLAHRRVQLDAACDAIHAV